MRYYRFGVTEYDRDTATPGLTLFSPLPQIPKIQQSGSSSIFRAYRYDPDGPEIQGRLDKALR